MTVKRKLLWSAAGAVAVVAVLAPLWAPPLLRRVAWFQVRSVEISGTRLLAPQRVLADANVRRGQNVWDDPAAWERGLLADPVIAAATVERRLPHTLRIRVREKQPLAYVEDGTLRLVTAAGEILPLDPTRTTIDLPVIRGEWTKMPAGERSALLAEADRLSRIDPALLAGVSEIRAFDSTATVVVLEHRRAEIVLPSGAGAARLAELGAVLDDLGHRVPAGSPAPARVDLRFGDQIVVRLPSSV
jgi:cell division protein FtsQ